MEAKTDYPALLAPGFHDITVDQIKTLFLQPVSSPTRENLTDSLLAFLEAFCEFEIPASVWIDGSYVTAKPNPSDVDLLLVLNARKTNALSRENQAALRALLDNRQAKFRFGCDVYYIPDDGRETEFAYWRGLFGFCRDRRTPKGIAVVTL